MSPNRVFKKLMIHLPAEEQILLEQYHTDRMAEKNELNAYRAMFPHLEFYKKDGCLITLLGKE